MVAERIEQLKSEYTDKYVKVDAARPELARFRDIVGQVKTVNMNGRALVEFLDYHLNIGWYDVDLSCLEVVDKPPPKAEKKPEAKKPAEKPAAKAAPAAKTEGATKAPAKPAAGKQSVADILAAARAGKSASAAKTEASPASAGGSATEKPAAPPPSSAPPKVDRAKMSVADMLAAARGGKGAPAAGAAPAAPAKPTPPPPEPEAATPPAAAPAKPAGNVVKVDRNSMSIDDKIAYCRKVDAT